MKVNGGLEKIGLESSSKTLDWSDEKTLDFVFVFRRQTTNQVTPLDSLLIKSKQQRTNNSL